MRYPFILLAFILALAGWRFTTAQTPAAAESDTAAKAALEAYVKAINEKNLDAIGKTWTEDSEHIADDGTATKGRAAIVAMFKKAFETHPKLTVAASITASKKLGTDVLLVDGVSEVTLGDAKDTGRFESLWVKSAEGWQLSRVRDLPTPAAGAESNYDALKELEWLVGDWTATSEGFDVKLTVKWGRNNNWLLAEQHVTRGDHAVTVTKIIGYDPSRGQLRTWVFDSDGGFGGAMVRRAGNTWIEESEALTRVGGEATATHTLKFVKDDAFEWSSTDRTLDGKPLPELKLTYTRTTKGDK